MSRPNVYLLYHFFHPDDVISARLFSDLAVGLTESGYKVTAFPSVRSCHGNDTRYARQEQWGGGRVVRVWRPNWKQSTGIGRLLNTLFMLIAWSWKAATFERLKSSSSSQTLVIGTDPIFGVLATIPWRIFRPRIKIIHWAHDVHPEASIADGTFSQTSLLIRVLRQLLKLAYRRCDRVIDLGPCMRKVLMKAGGWRESDSNIFETVTPWSLVEPTGPNSCILASDPAIQAVRWSLFGNCRLGLLYSGNLGRAHEVGRFIELARLCRNDGIHLCFAGRGPGFEQLKQQLTEADQNVSFAGFAEEAELQMRLSAADVHLVSLKDSWTGTVVPSKFFGALAIGRPVLFAGSAESSIAQWVDGHKVGWTIANGTDLHAIREALIEFASNSHLRANDVQHCWQVYRDCFSQAQQLSKIAAVCDE